MPAEQQDKPPQLWNQVLSAVAETLSPHAYDTWFRPIACVRCDADACELIVPTQSFRQGLLDNYSQVLVQTIARLISSASRLEISVQSPEALAESPASFPVVQACRLESAANTTPWLIERLWSAGAVGFVSGPPKSLKTWTALEMAVSVASGTPCFGSFAVYHPGPVLLYAAEDPMPALRLRIESLARNHGLVIDEVDIRVIAADSLRLDCPRDREKLLTTVDLHRPVLLILDPLVRLHGVDENQVGPMAELLGHVRSLQRMTGAAVAIVHHARKNAAHSAGQSLRGSSDLYAFLDSLVSLRRCHGRVALSAEHRSAPALEPLSIELVAPSEPDQQPSLRISTVSIHDPSAQDRLQDRITRLLLESQVPLTTDSIRAVLKVRKQRALEALRDLCNSGLILRDGRCYKLVEKR